MRVRPEWFKMCDTEDGVDAIGMRELDSISYWTNTFSNLEWAIISSSELGAQAL